MISGLQWILSSSILIGIVLAVRVLVRNRVSLRLRYALWLVVAVRLLVPVQLFHAPVSPGQVTRNLTEQMGEMEFYAVQTEKMELPEQDVQGMLDRLGPDTVLAVGYHGQSVLGVDITYATGCDVLEEDGVYTYAFYAKLPQLLEWVWIVGTGILLLMLLVSNLRFSRELKRDRRSMEVEGCPLPVYVVDGLFSPCLFGLFRPAIYLTPEGAEENARSHVLAHELTHYAHKDHIWALVRCLCLAVHWFNPLVWLAVFLSKRDSELACDEGAVARLGEEQRIPYGRTLVNLVSHGWGDPRELLSCSTAMKEGEKTVQQRIRLLIKHPETKKTALFAVVAVVALAAVFAFAGADGEEWDGTAGYGRFRNQVENTQKIYVGQPLYSSVLYPDGITDEDLLAQAKDILGNAHDLLTPMEEETDDAAFHSYTLSFGENWQEGDSSYWLYNTETGCYVLSIEQRDGDLYWEPVAVLPPDSHQKLVDLARQQYDRNWEKFAAGEYALTQAELTWFQEEFFNGDYPDVQNQFLTSFYDFPEDIDLFELFYLGTPYSPGGVTPEEERAVVLKSYGGVRPDCACTKITRAEMERVLQENMGLLLEDMAGTGLEHFTYLPAYEAYYVFHEDTNYYGDVTPQSGTRLGDIVTLYYKDERVVTLRQVGDSYQFISNRRTNNGSGQVSSLEDPQQSDSEDQKLGEDTQEEEIEMGSLAAEDGQTGDASEPPVIPPEGPVEDTPAPRTQWSASQSFVPDKERSMEWETDLRMVVTCPGTESEALELSVTGESGALEQMSVGSTGVGISPYYAAALTDWDCGETFRQLADAGYCENSGSGPQPGSDRTKWLRVTKNGQEISGRLWWYHGTGTAWFHFDFDEPITLQPGDTVVVELGPEN